MNEQTVLFDLLKEGVSPAHVVKSCEKRLEDAGFEKIAYEKEWNLKAGGRYYVDHHDTTLFAFTIPEDEMKKEEKPAVRIAAAHTDFPCLRIKPSCDVVTNRYAQVNIEVYGGAILNTWLDRPLGVAGRVAVRGNDPFVPEMKYFASEKNLLTIPNLAIHMNREANSGISYNAQKDMLPLFSMGGKDVSLQKLLGEQLGVDGKDILSHDLFLYDRMEGSIWGAEREFASCGRLDDLQCAFASLKGFMSAQKQECIAVHCVLDNEEVGSGTKQGAASTFLKDTLLRINSGLGRTYEEYLMTLADSFMISADNAHALHPNYTDKADPVNHPLLNKGIVIKYNANQKYCTDAVSAAVFKDLCDRAGVPWQTFVNRSDIPGGSTLGNISNTQVPMNTVDIGLPQLSMHSPYETAGVRDTEYFVKAAREFLA